MGEIADSILEGTLCSECGVYIDEGCGYPRVCGGCGHDLVVEAHRYPSPAKAKVTCTECGKRVKAVGLAQHLRDAHALFTDTAKRQIR